MTVFAVVPVKGLDASKKRLSSVLGQHERRLLTEAMLEDVLAALKASIVEHVLVVSGDSGVEQVAEKFGFSFLLGSRAGLNFAIGEATEWCVRKGAGSVLVLPADIPLVSCNDINRIIELGSKSTSVVLSPSNDGGTNLLFRNPANLIPPCFGRRSFLRHFRKANSRGATVKYYSSLGTVLDIDSADDLKKLIQKEKNTICAKVLEQLRFQKGLFAEGNSQLGTNLFEKLPEAKKLEK